MKRTVTLLLFTLVAEIVLAQQWHLKYHTDDDARCVLSSGDSSGSYDYFVGNRYDDTDGCVSAVAVCVYEDGSYKDRCFGQEGRETKFTDVLGLEDGNVFVSGICSDGDSTGRYVKLWVSVLNPDMEIVNEKYIELESPYVTYLNTAHLLINDNDEMVLLTRVADYDSFQSGNGMDYCFAVFDRQCNLLRVSYLENDAPKNEITDFTIVPNTGHYAILGNGIHVSGMMNVIHVDENFRYMYMTFFDDMSDYPDLMLPIRMSVGHWCDESHFLMSAQTSETSGVNKWKPFVVKMDDDMNVLSSLDFERIDTTDYVFQNKSMSYVNPDKIYVATFWERRPLPNEIVIYLVNDRLDLLGRKRICVDDYFFGLHVHAATDGDCVILGKSSIDDNDVPVMYKFDSDEFEIIVDVIEAKCESDMTSFPNPASSLLCIDMDGIENVNVHVYIVDAMGRRCLDKELFLFNDMLQLDVSDMRKGTYLYDVTVNGKSVCTDKFVKN